MKAVPKLDENESGQMVVVEAFITLAHSVSEKLIFTVVADNLFLCTKVLALSEL